MSEEKRTIMPPPPGPPPETKKKKKKKFDDFDDIPQSKYNRAARPGGMRRGGPPGGGMRRGGPPGMRMPGEKVKDFKGTLKRVLKYMAAFKWQLAIVTFMCICTSVASVFSPKVQGYAVNVLYYGESTGEWQYNLLTKWLLILGVIYVMNSLFAFIQQWTSIGVSQNIVRIFRRDIDDKLSRLPLKYYDSNTHGEILSRVTNDVDNVSNTLQQSITQIISSAITLIGVLVMMLSISVWLTLITLCTLPLYLLVIYIIAPRSQRYFVGQQRALGDINGHIEEMFTGQKIVKAYNHEKDSIDEFEEINNRYYKYSRRAQVISGLIMPATRFIGNLGYVLMCVVGGLFVSGGRILLGDMSAFLTYVRQFSQPINQTSNIANVIQSTLASAERIFEILDEVEEVPDADGSKDLVRASDSKNANGHTVLEGAVKFDHIEFGYSPEKILMKDLSIDVKPGQTIAVVGPTGAGKTTLVNLLMRFYDVSKGAIRIDGVDIREMTRESLRSIFGMVLQDTWLFNGSIRDNIAYGRPDATDKEIVDAAVAARADHFIRTLPEGYDTVLNEEGSNVSQGQKQLLTIARAFLADPAILILDEATSSVDTRTEILIQKAMEELMKGRTSFVIAHRLSTIRDADMILVMNQGSIIETGTHTELLAQNGFYADLYNSQFTGRDLDEAG